MNCISNKDLFDGALFKQVITGFIARAKVGTQTWMEFLEKGMTEVRYSNYAWEPIPLTPEILLDWFNAETLNEDYPSTIHYRIGTVKIYPQREKEAYIAGNNFTCEFVHDLQRIFYVETRKPLEGGPK